MSETLEQYCDYLKKIRGLSDTSVIHYLKYHRHFMDQPLTQENINKFIASKKNNSVVRAYMKSYLEFLERDREFDLPIVKRGTKPKRLIRPVSMVEINRLRDEAYHRKLRDGIIMDLLYYGALRRAEVITVNVNSFDWEDFFQDFDAYGKVRVTGKGKKERIVLVHPKAMKTLLEIYFEKKILTNFMQPAEMITKLNSMDAPLFRKMSEWSVWKVVNYYSKKHLQRDIRTHEIRHARATQLENDGASVKDIQRYLGHASLKTTEIYLHSSESKSLENIKEISENNRLSD